MNFQNSPETQPLLQAAGTLPSWQSAEPSTSTSPASTVVGSDIETPTTDNKPSRAVDDDVLPETSPLGRTLSWQSAYIIVISRVIGSGIFATPGSILRSVGSPGLSLTLWVVGSVIAACGLAISLEYGSMLPRSGGDKVYLEFTYRRPRFLASTLIAVYVVLLGFTASNCIVFSQYILFALHIEDASDALQKMLAVGLLTAVVAIHGIFPRAGVRLQNILGWIKVGIIVFMVISGAYVVTFKATMGPIHRQNLSWDKLWEDSNWNWGNISTSLFKVFYSYAGLDNANLVLNEVKNPIRTLRSVTFTALFTSCGLYVLANVAYLLVIPVEEIRASGELIAALFFERIFGPRIGRTILPMSIALSAAGNVLVVAFAQARLKQEIARQGFLPFSETLSSTRPFNSPLGGLFVHYIPSLLVITLPPSKEAYSFILEVEGYPGQVLAFAVAAGLVWLRVKQPHLKRPFKAWLPAVGLKMLLSIALLAAPFFPPANRRPGDLFYATYAIVGVSILAFAALYWYVWARLLPGWFGYRIEEQADVLADGTTITKLVKVPE